MLKAYYDLSVSPASYDIIGFLMAAELYRLKVKEPTMEIFIIEGPRSGFRADESQPQSTRSRRLLLNNVVIPMCWLLESVRGVSLVTYDHVIHNHGTPGEKIFPEGYSPIEPQSCYGLDVMAHAWESDCFPFQAKLSKPNANLVTITLREAHYYTARNSNRETWFKAAQLIQDMGKRVLFIPDVDSEGLIPFKVDPQAALNVTLRAQLYASAHHNFFVNNGPAWLAAGMREARCTVFKMIESSCRGTTEEYFKNRGFPKGSQIGREDHKIVWEDDSEDAVLPIVEEVCLCTPGKY